MGGSWSGGPPETTTLELHDGHRISVKYRRNAGLGFTPWPGTFALASYLDAHSEELGLQHKSALELGSGACSVAGLAAGHLCREAVLSDRPEVVHEIYKLVCQAGLQETVKVKIINWTDLDFTLSQQPPGAADLILMSDVVYFDMLWKPLLHTLLLLCTESTVVYWANCDSYPHFTPDLARFLPMMEEFFRVEVEDDRPQQELKGPNGVPGGRSVVRSMRLLDVEHAREEVERAMERNCARRCIP
mmetsp:Transcript_12906/g.29298  ORF Transcript_12906/g.29298 Transcript_12906/m.29298 type:complete len:245 (-) Transcript_12906:99-833(-)